MILWKSCCSLLLVGLATGCSSSNESEGPVVARAGNAVLTLAELNDEIPDAHVDAEERRRFVENWVREQLLYAEAIDLGINDKARVVQLIQQARRDLVVAAYINESFGNRQIEVTENDIAEYFHLHADSYARQQPEVKAQHILLGSRRDANALRQELRGSAVFEERARELSLDRATRANGGDLGYFTAEDDPELWEACEGLSQGQISLESTERGFHIIRLLDRKEPGSVKELAQVQQEISEMLVRQRHQERMDRLVDELKSRHDWSVAEALLRDG